MTTPSTERKAGPLLGTGAQTTWPFTFKVFAATDIAVTIADSLGVETALVYGVDYNVTLNANQETSPGGTVTYPISGSPLPVGSRLVIVGNLPYDQPLDLPSGGNFSPLALENQLDRLTMQIQQLREQVGRAVQVSVTTGANVGLPAPSANELIGWDSTGNNLQNFALNELATAVAYATMRYDTFTGDGVETQFTLTADPVTLANLDVAISGVTQVPGTDYSLLNGVLVFASAPANGTQILARYGEGLVNVGGDSSDIRFLPAGTGAEERTVQSKLREFVSVKDFGAVGNGVADDTAAIQAAIDADKGNVFFPAGVYRTTAPITMTDVTVSLYGEGKRFNTGIASEILIDHAGTGILVSDKAHIGVFLQDLRFNRANAYFTQGANVSFDGNGPGPSDVVSHVNMLRVHIQGGAYGLLLRGVIFGAFDYVTINSALNGVVFNGAGSAFPANNVISFSQLSISGATTAAVTFQGNAGRNIMFFNCDIESNNYPVYFNPATSAENVVFDGLWLEDNAQPIVIWAGTQLYFKHVRNANNAGIELFDRVALETGTAQDVFVEGQYGGSTSHFAGAANVNAHNMRTSDIGGYSYAVTALTGSRGNGSLIEPAVSGAQIMGTSVMDTVRQSGAFGKNYLINWNIPGSTSWIKTGATGVQTETDPLGGSTAYSWNGIVEGARVTPPALALGQFYEMVLWAKGAGVILLQNFGRPFYYNIDTASWTRLVFRVKITDLSQVMDFMAITLTPNVANGIQVWRPGIYDVMDAIDTRPSVQQGIYEGGYIDTAYTYGSRERTNIIVYGTAAPSAGDWLVGDKVMNTAPSAGGVSGWVCTTAGTPGTWKSFGAIAA